MFVRLLIHSSLLCKTAKELKTINNSTIKCLFAFVYDDERH